MPKILKFAYLGEIHSLCVIIYSGLTMLKEKRLVETLKEFKEPIGWTIADIKGLSPSTCMHRNILEEGSKPIREAQKRLNPPMMKVIKKKKKS